MRHLDIGLWLTSTNTYTIMGAAQTAYKSQSARKTGREKESVKVQLV